MKSATIVKFKADTEEYNRKVKQAKTTLQAFGAGGKEAGQAIGQLDRILGTSISTLGRLSIAASAVTGIVRLVNDAFVKAEANVDTYNSVMEQASSAYTTFCTTLRDGNWGSFLTDLCDATKYARELYTALDELGTYQLASSVDFAKIDRDRAQNKLDLKKRNISQADYDKKEAELAKRENKLISREKSLLTNSAFASLRSGAKEQGISQSMIDKFIGAEFGVKTVDEAKVKLKNVEDLIAKEKKALSDYKKKNHSTSRDGTASYNDPEINGRQMKINGLQEQKKVWSYLSNPDNFSKATQAYQLQQQAYQRETQVLRNQTKGFKDTTGTKTTEKNKSIKLDPKSLLIGKDVIDNMAQNLGYPDGKIPPIKIPVEMEFDKSQTGFALMALQTEKLKSTAAGLQSVFSQASSSLSDFGESSKEAAVAARTFTIAAAIATLVGQFAAIPKGVEIWSWIAGTIAGTATLITTIASLKSVGSFAEGGIIPGPDTGGRDSTYAYVSPGEIILNKAQQRSVASQLTNNSLSNLNLTASIRNEDLRICLNSNSVRRGKGEYVTSRR